MTQGQSQCRNFIFFHFLIKTMLLPIEGQYLNTLPWNFYYYRQPTASMINCSEECLENQSIKNAGWSSLGKIKKKIENTVFQKLEIQPF